MNRFIWLGSFALLSSPLTAWSQEPGSRVRVTEVAGARHVGTLVTAGADTVVMRLDRGGETVAYPNSTLSRFEMSEGRKGNAGKGAIFGFAGGAALGALVASSGCGACGGSDGDLTGLAALLGAGIGGGVGLVVGAVAGSSFKTDRWASSPLRGMHVSAGPAGRGSFGVALSFRF